MNVNNFIFVISSFNIIIDVRKWKVGVKKNITPAKPKDRYFTPILKKNNGIMVKSPEKINKDVSIYPEYKKYPSLLIKRYIKYGNDNIDISPDSNNRPISASTFSFFLIKPYVAQVNPIDIAK